MTKIIEKIHWAVLAALLPCLTGCGGGGGVAALGSLFASLGGGVNASAGVLPLEGGSVATVVNPEPASMLLLGGGMATMAYFKGRSRKGK